MGKPPTAHRNDHQPEGHTGSAPTALDVRLTWENLPPPLLRVIDKLAKDEPRRLSWIKDYLPALTPIAAVLVSFAVYSSSQSFNERQTANAVSSTLSTIIGEFGHGPSNDAAGLVSAMQIAIQGEQVLPAVKMVLSSPDDGLRNGAVKVVQQMYVVADASQRTKLVNALIDFYQTPLLRIGVGRCFSTIASQLSQEHSQAVFLTLKKVFGDRAEQCSTVGDPVALEAGKFVARWKSTEPRQFAVGLVEHCPANWGARLDALTALSVTMKPLLSTTDREKTVQDLVRINTPLVDPFVDAAVDKLRSER